MEFFCALFCLSTNYIKAMITSITVDKGYVDILYTDLRVKSIQISTILDITDYNDLVFIHQPKKALLNVSKTDESATTVLLYSQVLSPSLASAAALKSWLLSAIKSSTSGGGTTPVEGSSVSSSDIESTHKSPTDFTAAYTSGTTITLSTLPFTVTDSSQIVGIKVVPASGDAVVYKNGENGVTMRISSGVITISGVTDPFTTGDVYEVGINEQDKAYDPSTNAILTSPIKTEWNQQDDIEPLVSAQALTASDADFGAEIDMRGFDTLGIWLTADVNDSLDVVLKALGKHTSAGADEYDVDGVYTKTLWSATTADFKKYYEFNCGAMTIVQLQAIAGTVGSTAGTLTIGITKRWLGGK
jgi:hypothetical protein